ncbi:hypothetical protein [Levilactobacillus angrenensis]|uniref:Uncharacterized protein n=1 Tax=Levilactobacillus angrenensis TaxID=2486020 RepID=A0ABW1U900_9LACO|nr:hypothetical protein [Levilactobacillus angrenensis]
MNLRHIIGSLMAAVIILGVVSGLAWFTMGKHTTTHQSTSPVGVLDTPHSRNFRASVK